MLLYDGIISIQGHTAEDCIGERNYEYRVVILRKIRNNQMEYFIDRT